jgi:predicted Zn-dependent protease
MSPQQESEMGAQAYQQTLAKAGYDPHASRDLLVRMAAAPQGSGKPPEFLSTHPSDPARIQQIKVWMPEAMQYYRPR